MFGGLLYTWYWLEDELAYALGQLEAWNALDELGLPPPHLKLARLYLVFGSLHLNITTLGSWNIIQLLRTGRLDPERVVSVLQQRFGLNMYLARASLQHFEYLYHKRDLIGLFGENVHDIRKNTWVKLMNKKISDIHTYTLSPSWMVRLCLLFFPLLGVAWTVLGLFTFLPSFYNSFGDSLGTTLAGFVFFLLMVFLYRAIGSTRLVLTDDGITYSTLGYRMYTPWKNVIKLETFRPYPFTLLHARNFTGIKLRQKYMVGMTLEEGRAQQLPVLETDWWNPAWSMAPFADRLPIVEVIVGHNWWEKAFGRDFQRYAPWLFE